VCRLGVNWRVKNKNKYIERNLCVTLVIYQESLHDARLTKCKIIIDVSGQPIGHIFWVQESRIKRDPKAYFGFLNRDR